MGRSFLPPRKYEPKPERKPLTTSEALDLATSRLTKARLAYRRAERAYSVIKERYEKETKAAAEKAFR